MTEDPRALRREQKDRLLEAAFMNAAFDGWNRKTLQASARDAGIDPATARRLFPDGQASLLDWLDDWADRRMIQATGPAEELTRLKVGRRIARLVRARLEVLTEHKEAMRRAAAARAWPAQALDTGQSVWRTVDRIWIAAGFAAGREEGLSWYTRRATLASVLTATFLYWLEDPSEDGAPTWAFLDRQLAAVARLGRLTGRLRGLAGGVPGFRSA